MLWLSALLPRDLMWPGPRRPRRRGAPAPIIFLTVRESVSDLDLGFAMGASDYVSKPFDVRELLARVKARLPPAIQEFDGYLRVDGPRRLVKLHQVGGGQTGDLNT